MTLCLTQSLTHSVRVRLKAVARQKQNDKKKCMTILCIGETIVCPKNQKKIISFFLFLFEIMQTCLRKCLRRFYHTTTVTPLRIVHGGEKQDKLPDRDPELRRESGIYHQLPVRAEKPEGVEAKEEKETKQDVAATRSEVVCPTYPRRAPRNLWNQSKCPKCQQYFLKLQNPSMQIGAKEYQKLKTHTLRSFHHSKLYMERNHRLPPESFMDPPQRANLTVDFCETRHPERNAKRDILMVFVEHPNRWGEHGQFYRFEMEHALSEGRPRFTFHVMLDRAFRHLMQQEFPFVQEWQIWTDNAPTQFRCWLFQALLANYASVFRKTIRHLLFTPYHGSNPCDALAHQIHNELHTVDPVLNHHAAITQAFDFVELHAKGHYGRMETLDAKLAKPTGIIADMGYFYHDDELNKGEMLASCWHSAEPTELSLLNLFYTNTDKN